MGALANAFSFGTPATAAASSMRWGEASTGLTAAGDILSGIGQSQQYGYMAQVARNNAAIMEQNVGATIQAGSYEESASKLKYGQLEAQQKAAEGANGVDVNVGSTVATRDTTEKLSAMDAAMIHYNAARAAWGEQNEANALRTQAKVYGQAGTNALFGGLFKAGGTLLSGASSIGGRYANWQLAAGSGQ